MTIDLDTVAAIAAALTATTPAEATPELVRPVAPPRRRQLFARRHLFARPATTATTPDRRGHFGPPSPAPDATTR